MKKIALVIVTVLASLSLMAQEAGTFVVAGGGQGVLFHVDGVDSISFNPADTTNALPARKLASTVHDVELLQDEMKYAKMDISFLVSMVVWLQQQRDSVRKNMADMNDRMTGAYQRIKAHESATDSLEALYSNLFHRHDSLFVHADSLFTRHDSLFTRHDSLFARHDSLFACHDSILISAGERMARADSLLAQMDTLLSLRIDSIDSQRARQIGRLDSLTLLTDSVVRRLQRVVGDTLSQKLTQAHAVLDRQQQTIQRLTGTVDSLRTALAVTQQQLRASQSFTDASTGTTYKMALSDGMLTPVPAYYNILVLGNSFTTHSYVDDLWWSTHSMAASTSDVTWVKYLEEVSGAEVDILPGWHFEWNYQKKDFDFELELPIAKSYDVVIVQLQENAWPNPSYDYQAAWERLYTYLKTKCPKAVFVQFIGWYVESRYEGITRAAEKFNIPIVDNREATMTGNFSPGDYVFSNVDKEYYAINDSAVARHPSDVGFLLTANNCLRQLGLPTVEKRMHALNVEETEGGKLSVPYGQWPQKGLVSVRVEPDEGWQLQSVAIVTASGRTIKPTLRSNAYLQEKEHDYYTFIMPSDDVTITPVWKKNE